MYVCVTAKIIPPPTLFGLPVRPPAADSGLWPPHQTPIEVKSFSSQNAFCLRFTTVKPPLQGQNRLCSPLSHYASPARPSHHQSVLLCRTTTWQHLPHQPLLIPIPMVLILVSMPSAKIADLQAPVIKSVDMVCL